MALNFTTYFTLSEMKALRDLATSSTSYKEVINATLAAEVIGGIGFLVKKVSSYALPLSAAIKFADFAGKVHAVDRQRARDLYAQCVNIMEGSNFNTVRFQLVAESSEGIYLAQGLPKVTGYRKGNGAWITIN